ncbi:MAG TPA: hypothetical protein VJA22_02815 [Patescibacteria group bacterium]|nr:hypothetical protein [Patescibacteria group bacterium]
MARFDQFEEEPPLYNTVYYEWKFPEFDKPERKKGWFIISGLVAAALITYSIATYNFLFLVIILLVIFILYLYHVKEVEDIDFRITDNGIEVDNNFHVWKNLKSFSIIYEPPQVKNLYFDFHSVMRPHLVIPLQDTHPLAVRELLLQFLGEDLDRENEPFSHIIGRELKM